MAGGLKVGINETLFYNSGTYGSPTWVAVTGAQDVMLSLGKTMAEVKARLASWIQKLPALKTLELEFGLLGDTSLAPYDIFRNAWLNDTLMDVAVCDSATIATAGAESMRMQVYVSAFPIDQKLEDAQQIKVKCELGYSANLPAFTNS